MIDLTRLTPAPWLHFPERRTIASPHHGYLASCESLPGNINRDNTNAAFITLARNAFDVRLRRWWYSRFRKADWYGPAAFYVYDQEGYEVRRKQSGTAQLADPTYFYSDDPDTCLVEADAWYRENVEKGAT